MEEMPRDHRPAVSVRILLAGDRGTISGGLALLLGLEPDFTVVAEVERGSDAVIAARDRYADVAVLDAVLADGEDALDTTVRLLAEMPDCRVLILAGSARPGYPERALAAGAAGLLVKDGPLDDLVHAVRRSLTGEKVIDPALAPPPPSPPAGTARAPRGRRARRTGRAGKAPAPGPAGTPPPAPDPAEGV
ncbi:response regulator [Streptomyces sp. NPDC006798]|uniref:response regulator n=1 Tax=Streptomyces sp. NPDC006798 TaxID=3155462 RepID=UPI0034100782